MSQRNPAKEEQLKQAFSKKELALPVYYYNETDSTMDLARRSLEKTSELSALYVTDIQTAGRGRQEREWQSLPGNLFCTYAFKITGELKKLSGFSLVAGLSLLKALAELGYRTRLKWPNDILTLSEKKLAGILVEISEIKGAQYLLCGIGLNLVAYPSDVPNVTSLKEVNGASHTPSDVLKKLSPLLINHFERFIADGFSKFKNEWMLNAAFVGRDVTVKVSKEKTVTGMFLSVNSEGALQIENNGKIDTVTAGDLALR